MRMSGSETQSVDERVQIHHPQQRGMSLACRAELRLDSEVNLQCTPLKPTAAAHRGHGRLVDLGNPQNSL